MNSLQTTSGYARKTLIALMITGLLAIAAGAQTVQPQRQGAMYGDPGFRGEPINLNVVNADIRDILNYITEQYGINFVIDKSVKAVPVTVNSKSDSLATMWRLRAAVAARALATTSLSH